MKKIIVIKKKDVYGHELLYVTDEKLAASIRTLTGKNTVSRADIDALESLGFNIFIY